MIIIETCPECGHDLRDEVICTYPPIPRKACYNCGWSWEGEREEVVRVPFKENNINLSMTNSTDNLLKNIKCINEYDEIMSTLNYGFW